MYMYTRSLNIRNNRSFFLFGPRGVGKSSWVNLNFPDAKKIDLLKTAEVIKYQSNPELIHQEVQGLEKSRWIFIDEIQKLPQLLDDVHALIEQGYKFILTGSSARKIKRQGANLLAGRATTEQMFPFTSHELGQVFDLELSMAYGNLPLSVNSPDPQSKVDYLQSYFETYLREEIQQEALVKNLSAFSRFLRVAAISHGQKVNLSAIARDAGVERPTAQGYFQILVDTLIGDLLKPWPLKFRVKEVDHPKFYFFDSGVVRAILNQLQESPDKAERGTLFETLVFNELKAFNRYKKIGGEFYFWGLHGGAEVDFIYSRGKKAVGIEVKSSSVWKSDHGKSLKLLREAKKIQHAYAVYLGPTVLKDGPITVYPFLEFIKALYSENIPLFD